MKVTKQVENNSILSVVRKLKNLNWEPIAYKLMYPESGQGWTKEQTGRAIALYIMFLALKHQHPHVAIVPSQNIDRVWHTHILDTEKYAQDCQQVFGCVLHHFPYFGLRGEEDKQNLQTSFSLTQSLFLEHFNILMTDESKDESNKPSICILQTSYPVQPSICIMQENVCQSRPGIAIDLDSFLFCS
jgi:hypothetical protein